MRRSLCVLGAGSALFLLACGGDDSTAAATTGAPPNLGTVGEIMANLPQSCSFQCGSDCAEPDAPFVCPTLKPWAELPHDAACPAWDGKYPDPAAGKCTVTDATSEAARKAGPIPGGVVLPDGHFIQPAGREVVFDEPDLHGGFPMSILPIPGSRFAITTDGGIKDNAVRIINLDALAATGKPVKSYVAFPQPQSIYWGVAWLPPGRALVSGGGDGKVYAFDVDTVTGVATRAAAQDISLGTSGGNTWYVSGIAVTADGSKLLAAPSEYAEEIAVVSLGAADYGKKLASISTKGSARFFDIARDPFDPAGTTFYATDVTLSRLVEIDGAANKVTRTIALDKNPAQMAFLDAQWLVVAEADSDSVAIVDRAAGTVAAHVPIFDAKAALGSSPTALVYDAAGKRLYATLEGVNAVAAFDVGPGSPPTLAPAGRIPTAWWPTAAMVDSDGSLVVLNGKGHGTGTDGKPYTWGDGPITSLLRGSVQHVPQASLVDLTAATKTADASRSLAVADGAPKVTCPDATWDFPIPKDPASGPSKQIDHVILIVRENKTYDAILGDRKDLGDGDPKLIMAPDVGMQDAVWKNLRTMAGAFSNFDNFYTDAEQSIQGHIWTVYGRSNDWVERAWLSTWGRATRPLTSPNTSTDSQPKEGGIFKWLDREKVDYDDMGEAVGTGEHGLDGKYPGLIYGQNVPDVNKSCYLGGRIRLLCDLKPFTYALHSNDHTYGGQAGAAAPEVFIAVNDEAIGMLLDALSHGPLWKSSLLMVVEDDPQDGGDHVDQHRSILVMASPWVRRGYVSHGHTDMASVYKIVAHVLGIPYNNAMIEQALLPVDAFTSTPDYTPFEYTPRTVTAPCNGSGTKEAEFAKRWDFDDLDDQPGLSQQIGEMMKDPARRGVKLLPPRKRP